MHGLPTRGLRRPLRAARIGSYPRDLCCKSDSCNDFFNTPNFLMDNLNPHLAGVGQPKYTWQVTLPNVECDNCTLQVIQVMEDNQFHGDYDPTPGVGVEDLYHQCIDLVLKRGPSPDAAAADAAGPDGAGTGGSGGSAGTGGSGGSSGTGGAGGTGGA